MRNPKRPVRRTKPLPFATRTRHKGLLAAFACSACRQQASFDIKTGEKLAGEMDADDEIKVRAWISIHREDLFANWELLLTQGKFFKIEPLH